MKALTVLATLLVLAGCSKPDSGGGAASMQAAITPAAQEMFTQRCAPCHGATGRGDGPGSVALDPKPRNYTDATWQKGVKDEDIKKTILYGGAAVGKSVNMPANPDLDGKPELEGLLAIVRSFNGK